jgi:hypothetical protein
MAFEKENLVRLYVANENGAYLEIRPNPDCPDVAIELATGTNEASKKWWHEFRVSFSPDEARTLGKTLYEFADKFDIDNA